MSAAPPPIPCAWDGESFTPASSYWGKMADKHFVVGQVYPVEIREDRSAASHRHYFAAVKEAFDNLREDEAERFATPDHLRRWALIRAGFRDERSIACASQAEAVRLAGFIKPMDDYAVVVVNHAVVTVLTAKSQSVRAMGKQDFARSKEAVLDILASLIGTTTGELAQAGEAA